MYIRSAFFGNGLLAKKLAAFESVRRHEITNYPVRFARLGQQ